MEHATGIQKVAGVMIARRPRVSISVTTGCGSPSVRWWSTIQILGIAPAPGPVELGVAEEIDGLASAAHPGLAQAALALARILDNPKAVNQQPAAAKVLAMLLTQLRSVSARGRRGGLAVVRTMTENSGAP